MPKHAIWILLLFFMGCGAQDNEPQAKSKDKSPRKTSRSGGGSGSSSAVLSLHEPRQNLPFSTLYATTHFNAAVAIHPRQLAVKSPFTQLLQAKIGQEFLQRIEQLGIDPLSVEELMVLISTSDLGMPHGEPYGAGLVLTFNKPTPLTIEAARKLIGQGGREVKEINLDGFRGMEGYYPPGADPFIVARNGRESNLLVTPTGDTWLLGPKPVIEEMLSGNHHSELTPLLADAQGDLVIALDQKAARFLKAVVEGQGLQRMIPEQFQSLVDHLLAVEAAVFTASFHDKTLAKLELRMSSGQISREMDTLLEDLIAQFRLASPTILASMPSNDRQQREMLQAAFSLIDDISVQRYDSKLTMTLRRSRTTSELMEKASNLLVAGMINAKVSAMKTSSINSLKQLVLSLLEYESATTRFPGNFKNKNGEPILSWRVAILPFIDHSNLYKQFHLDESWDSEHNKKLISQMPNIFLHKMSKNRQESGLTNYQGLRGQQTLFPADGKRLRMRDVKDGLSNTIALIETTDENAVIWTKPDDFDVDAPNPIGRIGSFYSDGTFSAALADGSIHTISQAIDLEVFRALCTRDGAEIVEVP